MAGARAGTTEPLSGHLTRDGEALVLTLELDPSRLGFYADKAGHEAEFDQAALKELIRERFHYLLRWRSEGHDSAPTSIDVAGSVSAGEKFLPLTAMWNHFGASRGEVIAQSDSREFQLAFTLADQRDTKSAVSQPLISSKLGSFRAGMMTGTAAIFPAALGQVLFVLGLYFSTDRKGGRVLRLVLFLIAQSLTLALAMSGPERVLAAWRPRLEFAVGISVVGLAVANCAGWLARTRATSVLLIATGAVHGFALASALPAAVWPTSGVEAVGAILAVELTLVTVASGAALFRGAFDRPEFAVPASVVVGLGGVGWTLQCLQ